MMIKRALILIDIQVDFCEGGALSVPNGNAIIPIANELMDKFETVIATQDWHPANHNSFAANHLWRKPGQVIEINGMQQELWPIHCVQNSFGAELMSNLDISKIDKIFKKGTDKEIDSYSGFFDNGRKKSTGLSEFLKLNNIKQVYIMGLATDYCVKFTVLDAIEQCFETFLIIDGIKGVNINENDDKKALELMKSKGAKFINANQIKIQTN